MNNKNPNHSHVIKNFNCDIKKLAPSSETSHVDDPPRDGIKVQLNSRCKLSVWSEFFVNLRANLFPQINQQSLRQVLDTAASQMKRKQNKISRSAAACGVNPEILLCERKTQEQEIFEHEINCLCCCKRSEFFSLIIHAINRLNSFYRNVKILRWKLHKWRQSLINFKDTFCLSIISEIMFV